MAFRAAALTSEAPMSYIALARKWRPRKFSQLVGQEHVNKALIKSLDQQRMHHAYLFTGTRGVGKTSIARLVAKSLNCERSLSANPCLTCDACISIEQGRFLDLIEIDGASKTRVEDTRELLENVQYSPTNGRFKIYLIDEVHMLSTHSFNALLKTLEEPPEHVKFLLATTDPQKLPVTVLSRCLQFHLKPLQIITISQQLKHILTEESVPYEEDAIAILAKAAQGSMRDALSLLDQVIASSGQTITENDVKTILGYTSQDYALQLLRALVDFELPKLLTISQQISAEGANYSFVLEELIGHLHQVCITQGLGENIAFLSPSQEIVELSKRLSNQDAHLFYQIALKGLEELHLAPTTAIGFEMTLLRMHSFQPAADNSRPKLACESTSKPIPDQNDYSQVTQAVETAPCAIAAEESTTEDTPLSINEAEGTSPTERVNNIENPAENDNWQSIITKIKLSGLALSAVEHAEFAGKDGGRVTLRVASGHQSLFTPTIMSRIEQALSNYYKNAVKIILHTNDAILESPAQKKKASREKMQQDAEQALQNDPFFQQLQEAFSAELVKDSIGAGKDDL